MFLAHAPVPYDVIISEPSNPWLAGVNNLFTVDFDRLVRQHLAPSGVFCQWVQYYELSGPTLASILRSFDSVFPHAQVFLVGRDLIVVATVDGAPLDLANVERRLTRAAVAKDIARAGVRTPADLVALRQCALSDLVAALPPAPLNRDDRPYVEYRAPIDLYTVSPAELPVPETALRSADPVKDLAQWTRGTPPTDLAITVAASLMASGNLVPATYWISSLMSSDRARAVPLFAQLTQATADYNRRLELSQARDAFAAGRVDEARRRLEGVLRENPRWATAMIERARIALHADSLVAARALLEAALPVADDDDRYNAYIQLGVLSMREEKTAEGIDDFARCNAIHPAETEAWILRARALAMTGQAPAASAVLAQARRVAADSTAVTTAQNNLQATGTIP
jgi:tetratricopeptide (TPR) repeat protein